MMAVELSPSSQDWQGENRPEDQLADALDHADAGRAAAILRSMDYMCKDGVDMIAAMLAVNRENPRLHEINYPYRLTLEPRGDTDPPQPNPLEVECDGSVQSAATLEEEFLSALRTGNAESAAAILEGLRSLSGEVREILAAMLAPDGEQDEVFKSEYPYTFRLRRWRSRGRPRLSIYDKMRIQRWALHVGQLVECGMTRKDAIAEVERRTGKAGKQAAIAKAYDRFRPRSAPIARRKSKAA